MRAAEAGDGVDGNGRGRYVYAISRDVDGPDIASTTGLGGSPLVVVSQEGLSAVVSDVDLDEFGEEGLRRNLEDLSWLEQVARKHDEVVHAVAAAGPTAPMRLATICSDDEAVRRRLTNWHTELVAVLDHIEGRVEWSVKLVAGEAMPVGTTTDASVSAESGSDYLARKRHEAEGRAALASEIGWHVDAAHAALASAAVEARRLPPQDPRLTGLAGTMVLNGAYLVDLKNAAGFESKIHELEASSTQFQVLSSGPWPPYSFAMLEDET